MTTAHLRIRNVLHAHGITPADIEAKLWLRASLGRPVAVDLQATQFGARVVAAMLELLEARLTESRAGGEKAGLTPKIGT